MTFWCDTHLKCLFNLHHNMLIYIQLSPILLMLLVYFTTTSFIFPVYVCLKLYADVSFKWAFVSISYKQIAHNIDWIKLMIHFHGIIQIWCSYVWPQKNFQNPKAFKTKVPWRKVLHLLLLPKLVNSISMFYLCMNLSKHFHLKEKDQYLLN